MDMDRILDFTEICRTCLSKTKLMQTIFEVKLSEVHNVRLIDFIRRLTSIKVARSDQLPNNICVHCINRLCKAFDFAEMCITNDFKLRDQLKNQKLTQLSKTSIQETDNKIENEIDIDEGKDISNEEIFNQIDYEKYNEGTIISRDDENKNFMWKEIKASEKKNHCENGNEVLNKEYKCNICDTSYKKDCHLKNHMKSHHKTDNEFVCNVCGQKFNYLYLLNKHYYKHQDTKPFPCKLCSKGCITAESLRRHMKIHDKSYVKKIHVCEICLKEFPYPSFLAEHMKNHTGERPYLCAICGKGFRQSGTLQYHMRSHTGSRPYICNICQNTFASPGVLKVHMRIHTNERPYVCDICGMAFKQSTDMKSHRRTHTGDKRALCTICGKRFSSSSQLNIHIRSHTGEKPYLCASCSKSFSTKAMLVKHERIHTGERPYVCKICSKAFNQSSSLNTHLNTHKPVKETIGETVKNTSGENGDKITVI